jgi:diaminopimelate epimerase
MRFTKMHGLGNDYVYVDARTEHIENPPDTARKISDRHTVSAPTQSSSIHRPSLTCRKMYNADGSRGRMCGNGIRCVAKYAVEHGMTPGPLVRVETDSGIKECQCISEPHPPRPPGEGRGEGGTEGWPRFSRTEPGAMIITRVRVDMGIPSLRPADLPSTIKADRIVDYPLRLGSQTTVTCIDNPHAVCSWISCIWWTW